ncbi:hypothetical protein N9J84_01605 [Porticoccaceae bacterium]|nr:hypothetical protein [Porticoccaceae bacterium]
MDTELLKSIEETERHLKDLKKQLEEAEMVEKVKGLWEPMIGNAYFRIGVAGEARRFRWANDTSDRAIRAFHNAFPSMGVAEKAAALMRRSNLVISACLQVDPDFEPDWDNRDQAKWFPRYDHGVEAWFITTCYRIEADVACVSSKEKGKEALAILNSQDK